MNPISEKAVAAYRTAATQIHPLVAVVRLYDEMLRCLDRAIDDARGKRPESCYKNIMKVTNILRGLDRNLRFDAQCKTVAEDLQHTYLRNMMALHFAFGKPDAPEKFGKIREGLATLRDAWADIAGMNKNNLAAGEKAA